MGEASDFSTLAAASNAISTLAEWQRWGNGSDGDVAALLSPRPGVASYAEVAASPMKRTRAWSTEPTIRDDSVDEFMHKKETKRAAEPSWLSVARLASASKAGRAGGTSQRALK